MRTRLSLGLLLGFGVALVLADPGHDARAGGGDPECWVENECTPQRPNILILLDTSGAMNQVDAFGTTRWDAAKATLAETFQPDSWISQGSHLALARYGHDPDPAQPGTPSPGTDLIDGFALDKGWYDPDTLDYLPCSGDELLAALDQAPPPSPSSGAWTRGALARAAAMIAESRAVHDEQTSIDRHYLVVLLTQAGWTSADGTSVLAPASDDPIAQAAALFEDEVTTFVVGYTDDPAHQAAADALAEAGGSVQALDPAVPLEVANALWVFVENVLSIDIWPVCWPSQPRITIVLDASSTMLNVDDQAGGPGETPWDRSRALLDAIAAVPIEVASGAPLGSVAIFSLVVLGDDQPPPGEQRVLVPFTSCASDNVAWALDPNSSCVSPGCEDPWGGPPIEWTVDACAPNFPEPTSSHMPRCQGPGPGCAGSGSFLHLGLQLAADNQAQAHAAGLLPGAKLPSGPETRYWNILITDGHAGESTDLQIQSALESMFSQGMITYVVATGAALDDPALQAQLAQMAAWGSGGTLPMFSVDAPDQLAQTLASAVNQLSIDPCCAYDCSMEPEPPVCDGGSEESGDDTTDSASTDESSTESGESESSSEGSSSDESTDEASSEDEALTWDADEIGTDGADDLPTDLLDRGCACSSAEPSPVSAWAPPLLLLGLLGLRRRPSAAGG